MKATNLAILRGNLGTDPVHKAVSNDNGVVELRLATHRRWTDRSGESQERTDWHTVSVWGAMGKICMTQFKKGDTVQVLGSIRNDVVDTDGKKRVFSSIRAFEVHRLFTSSTLSPAGASSVGVVQRTPGAISAGGGTDTPPSSTAVPMTGDALPF